MSLPFFVLFIGCGEQLKASFGGGSCLYCFLEMWTEILHVSVSSSVKERGKWSLVPTGWYCLRMRQHRCLPVSKHPPPHKYSNSLAFWKLPSAAEDNSLSSRWYICLWRAFQTVRLSYSLVYILMWLDWWFIVVPNRKNFCITDCLQGVTSGQLP